MAVEAAEIYVHIFERGRHDVSPDFPSLPQKKYSHWNSIVSCVGYKSLNDIIANLGAIIGYWSMAYFILIVEESVIFRGSRGYDLYGWDNPHVLPVGFAAMLAFGVGIAGAVVGMSQTWYTGPIARMIGEDGGDIGTWLAMSFAAVAYPGLRYFELKRFDR